MTRGRRRIEIDSKTLAEIKTRTERGESAEVIRQALGGKLTLSTIKRRQDELRGKAPNPASITASNTPAPVDVPEDVPENTPIEQLNKWIDRLEIAATRAEETKNLSALASIAAKVTALISLRHKATPIPKADPNERPDYQALAKKGEERLLTLIKGTFRERREQAGFANP